MKTTLYSEHAKLGARFVPFSGYDMPVQYSGLIDEHQAVRNAVGLFDVSHMGILRIAGPDHKAFADYAFTRDLSKLAPGQGAYTLLCLENGGTVDDLIVYRENDNTLVAVLNAGNKHKDFKYLKELAKNFPKIEFHDAFETHGLLALQGPRAFELLKVCGFSEEPPAFTFKDAELCEIPVQIAFTGYTGERGCEILCSNEHIAKLWNLLLEKGKELGIKPCGLGARDTLRTEMGYSLYGHELSETINPIEAGLSWAVNLTKTNFVGKKALEVAKAQPKRKLVALKNSSRQAPRAEMKVFDAHARDVGFITSGTFAPSLGHVIGLALVDAASSAPYSVEIRGQKVLFDSCKRPFYSRA